MKETARFPAEKCEEIKVGIFGAVDWLSCAYPLQVPILRMAALPSFREPRFVEAIVDAHLQTDSTLFFREAIALGYPCLDRSRLRNLATEVFDNVPDFVQRVIYQAVKSHAGLGAAEKRPLLKNMKQKTDDWFIDQL